MNDSLVENTPWPPATSRRLNWTAIMPDEPNRAKGIGLGLFHVLLAFSLAVPRTHRHHQRLVVCALSVVSNFDLARLAPASFLGIRLRRLCRSSILLHFCPELQGPDLVLLTPFPAQSPH